MSEQRVRIDREADGKVAVVVLTRPEKHNALDREMVDAIDAATIEIRALAIAGEINAVVLRGEGKSFCSGLDIASIAGDDFQAGIESMLAKTEGDLANLAQRLAYHWKRVEVPVIAALHGNVLGGGLQIALGADIRIAAPDAKLAVAEIRWGLIPDMAITTALPKLVGIDHAKELTLTGRNISGTDAAAIGLVTRTADDPAAEALALATEIATTKSPLAVRHTKRLFDEVWESDDETRLVVEETLQREILAKLAEAAAAAQG